MTCSILSCSNTRCTHLQIQWDHLILFTIHPARKCLTWTQNCLSFSETSCSWAFLRVCACVFVCRHTHASPCSPRTFYRSSRGYLLDTVPGISLLIVQRCRSGMATEPRHCTQRCPSWNRMQHRFWCGTETNITAKVNALLNIMLYKDGTCFAVKQQMSSLFTTSLCKPQKAQAVRLRSSKNYRYADGKNERLVYLFVMPGGPFGRFISLPCFFESEKRSDGVMAKAIYCSKGSEFSNFTEWHSLEKRFQATNRFLVPLAWDSGGKWSSVAVGRAPVHLRRRSSLGGSCVETTMKPHAVFAYRDGQ